MAENRGREFCSKPDFSLLHVFEVFGTPEGYRKLIRLSSLSNELRPVDVKLQVKVVPCILYEALLELYLLEIVDYELAVFEE